MLTIRSWRLAGVAARLVIDTELTIPLTAALVRTARETPTIVACSMGVGTTSMTAEKRRALQNAGVSVVTLDAEDMYQRHLDLGQLMDRLGAGLELPGGERLAPMSNVMIEAGAGLMGSMLDRDLVDEAVVYIAPILLADEQARAAAVGRVAASLSSGKSFELVRSKRLGSDIELTYRRL